MAKLYRKVSTAIWSDAKFRSLRMQERLTHLFVLTHPYMTSIGAMRASIAGLEAELMAGEEQALREGFREGFLKLCGMGLLECDETACYVGVPKFLEHNVPESPNVVRSWEKLLEQIPECELKSLHLQRVKAFVEGLGEGFAKALPKGWCQPYPNLELELELLKNTPLPPKGGGDPPEVDESPKPDPTDDKTVQAIVEAWNATPDVPKVSKLTDKRLRAIKARLKDSGFRENWPAGLQAISRSDFCRGMKPGASWRADFDWFLKPDTLVVLLEGKYANPGGQPGTRPASAPATNAMARPTAIADAPLLEVTTEEATDPAAFDGWFARQRTFDQTDRNRQDFHALRCSVHRILRRPEVARNELNARLAMLAAGRQLAEQPRREDIDQAARDLSQLAAGPARENAPAESRDLLPIGGAA